MINNILEKKLILNPNYILKHNVSNVILTTIVEHKIINPNLFPDTFTRIHPMFAILLSFFTGENTVREDIENISKFFNLSSSSVKRIINKFIENDKIIAVEYDGIFFYFPKNILVLNDQKKYRQDLSYNNFSDIYDVVLESGSRLNLPLSISILINNRCITDCIYCYADKRVIHDCIIPLSRLKELIQEAKDINLIDFDLKGGEIFLYKYWYELLKLIFDAGYTTYISTKYPINNEDIKKLVELGVREIQISLDSIYEEDLKKSVCIGSKYHKEILNSIDLLNKYGIDIKIKAVISNPIYNLQRIKDFIDYFKKYEYVKIVEITVPGHSAFKTDRFKLDKEQIIELKDMIRRLQSSYSFVLRIDNAEISSDIMTSDEKKEGFSNRAVCTGNQSSFMILPNGDVTMCEEVSFNSNLILGNILEDSITDVWRSQKAKDLFYIPQSKFPIDSPCSTCSEFVSCRYNSGICWADVIASYGSEKWMYPDPKCHLSPPTQVSTKNYHI